ncbi:hypothetical protein [Glutamicibacter sp.]|uniref:hypothetical protein n=1 Tax=Glutamicibacter sp. TaxID=1931995 RepID=UPI002B472A6C|nr:hypothetical protein [Glutamicibacter sp.]HJX78403.1 hypothetical protein [Glutamicibacter sp.]
MNIDENSSYRNHTAMHSGAASPLLEEQAVEKPVSSLSKSQKFHLIMLLLTLGLLIILPLCLAGFAVTLPHVGSVLFFLFGASSIAGILTLKLWIAYLRKRFLL